MIKLEINRGVPEKEVNKYSNLITQIHDQMEHRTSKGFEFLGWMDLPKRIESPQIREIRKIVNEWKHEKVEVLVVIGIGGSFLGAKAGIDLLKGLYPINNKHMEVIFAGTSLSSMDLVQKLKYVENKKFAINIISKSGTTLEPALAFRYFLKLLTEKVGKHNLNKFVVATTDSARGSLLQFAIKNDFKKLVIPDNIGGRFSVLTPVGLLPMAAAGCDIKLIIDGAKMAQAKYSSHDLKKNDAYKYAVARYILGKRYNVELFVAYEPQLEMFGEWLKQLFGESEGKNQLGLFPASAIFTRDLHSLGQYIQEGSKILFETVIRVETAMLDVPIIETHDDTDHLNYLVKHRLNEINNIAAEGVEDAHVLAAKVPNITIQIEKLNGTSLGELFYFFERACAMSAYLLNLNPFTQPGVEVYKLNVRNMLKKQ